MNYLNEKPLLHRLTSNHAICVILTISMFFIIVYSIIISNSASKPSNCQPGLVCGSDGILYETACDFQRAAEWNPNLRTSRRERCSNMPHAVIPSRRLLKLINKELMNPMQSKKLRHRRFFFLIPIFSAAAIVYGATKPKTVYKHKIHNHTHLHNHTHVHVHYTARRRLMSFLRSLHNSLKNTEPIALY